MQYWLFLQSQFLLKKRNQKHITNTGVPKQVNMLQNRKQREVRVQHIQLKEKEIKRNVTINNLFSMVIMLYNKYEKMEAEYNELKKYATITKKKINILEHLNENCKQEYLNVGLNFKKFVDGLVINQEMLDKIFKYDYVDGILNIFIEYIKESLLLPIKCFNIKENVLYIFDDEKWIIMDDDYLRIFIKSFDKKMLLQFLQWKIDSEKKFDSDTFGEIYIINMKKVIAGNFEKKNKVVMIRNRIYKYLKVDF